MAYRFPVLLALLGSSLGLYGQATPSHSSADHAAQPKVTLTAPADVLRSYTGLKANILKAANTMPAESYSYRPTPEVRTFARVVNHISEAQLHSCGAVNKTAPADLFKVPPETADKAAVVAALQASFAECDKALQGLTDANLLENFTVGSATRARISLAWATVSHDNEQYATLALYMRLKGLTPPSSEK
ncbi:MAG TPA: DinB family protein [Acidobacteriaceae bacterium]|nr:DinB family protein [Acidobacteriaceae bacterium]